MAIIEFEKEIMEHKHDIMIAVGNVNSTIACTFDASKMSILIADIEAELSSYDRTMPEKINRIFLNQILDY